MLPITQNFLLLCRASAALISLFTGHAGQQMRIYGTVTAATTLSSYPSSLNESHLNKQGGHEYEELSASTSLQCLQRQRERKQRQKDDRNGMCGVCQDKVVVLIVFLCTSSCVSHYCVQTRGDVYSAETSKSPAPGCNLVTSFSVLLPALLASGPFPCRKSAALVGRLNA